MPRISRNNLETSFFHIMVQGVNKEHIFYKEEYMRNYINLINQYKNDYDIEILAYCIMNNHAHQLIYAEEIKELSKFMKQINFIYAQGFNKAENRLGHVFRDRYLSEGIYSEKYLINCIKYIHCNPVKAGIVNRCEEYQYSSYNDYVKKTGIANNLILDKIIGKDNYKEILDMEEEDFFIDIDTNKKEILNKIINEYTKEKGKTIEQLLVDEQEAKHMIKMLKERYKIPYKEIQKKLKISTRKLESLK